MKQLFFIVFALVLIAAIIPITTAFEDHRGSWAASSSYSSYPASHLGNPYDNTLWGTQFWQTGFVGTVMVNFVNSTLINNNDITRISYYDSGKISPGDSSNTCSPYRLVIYNDTYEQLFANKPGYECYTSGIIFTNSSPVTVVNPVGISFRHTLSTQNYYSLYGVQMYWDERYPPVADFNATPLSGIAPLTVSFIDNSTSIYGGVGYNWTISPSTGVSGSTGAAKDHLATFSQNGNYTISHGVITPHGSDIETKTDYIWVYNSTATKTKWFQTIDGTNGNIVLNSSIQLKDVENSSWVNATGLTADGMSSITTLKGHTINAYAQSLGYSDADDLGILNDGQPEYIMMWPTFAENVSAGKVSLYVTVKDKDTKANIVGAGVTSSLASGSMSTTTNEAGIAYFIVTNNSMVLITAQAIGQGYQAATTTINTGTASGGSASAAATILLGKNTVTPVFSTAVTTLPGGGTPTPVITILPGCDDQISAAGQEKCRAAQSNQGLSFISANLLGLIQICFLVTVLYLLGIKLGK